MKKLISLFLSFAFLISLINLFSSSFSFAQEQKTTAAVIELQAEEGVSQSVARMLSDYLRGQLFNTQKFTLVTRENMEQILKEQAFQLSGCTSQECIVQAGQLLGVRKMFTGSVGKIGTTYVITLKMIDVESGKVEKVETEECAECKEDALIVSIKNISNKIAGFTKKGSLLIDSFPAKGSVYLNGGYVGNTPFSSEDILPGVYNLRVTSEKYVPFESRIQISPEKEKKVYIKMDPAESKIIKNPGYAYGTKLGIQLKVMEEDESLVSAGLLVYLPYARLSGSFSFISLYYLWGEGYKFSIPWKVETLINIPLDWLCIQFGISYSVYSYAHLTTSQYPPYARIVQENNFSSLGFPVGVEFFINSHLSLDFHIGPAFQFYQHYYNGNLDADKCNFMGAGNLVGMNYYF